MAGRPCHADGRGGPARRPGRPAARVGQCPEGGWVRGCDQVRDGEPATGAGRVAACSGSIPSGPVAGLGLPTALPDPIPAPAGGSGGVAAARREAAGIRQALVRAEHDVLLPALTMAPETEEPCGRVRADLERLVADLDGGPGSSPAWRRRGSDRTGRAAPSGPRRSSSSVSAAASAASGPVTSSSPKRSSTTSRWRRPRGGRSGGPGRTVPVTG
ncbi:CATRA conflict system CASPASE/TPR repeat-associated protein [Streptomyces sp. NPDC059766]|uniref:CATRA conflict system CASPASE/TPR repeat-associated protein n=1 Tax=Streptomyces sp. NPDC059766 TaxID=3346940 RepID=UPI003664C780